MINRISDPFFSHIDSGRKLCGTPIGYSPELSSREDQRVLQILDRIQYALELLCCMPIYATSSKMLYINDTVTMLITSPAITADPSAL